MSKRIGCLAVALIGCLLLTTCYFFYLSPNSGYYRYKFGLVKGKPFRIHGRVVDQYGEPVQGYKMALLTYFEADPASGGRSKVGPFFAVTDSEGRFSFDTSPVKLISLFYQGARFPEIINGIYYHGAGNSGGDIFFLNNDRWIRDGRWETTGRPLNAPHDEKKGYIYRVGRSGPPERMIKSIWHIPYMPNTDSYRCFVNVLTGKSQSGDCPDCDFELKVKNAKTACKTEGAKMVAKITGLNGATLQVVGDPFRCEAPPDGYKNVVTLESLPCLRGWLPTLERHLYFKARNGRVYGKMSLQIGHDNSCKTMDGSITIVANPRGQRNLNDFGRSPIPLPVTLPFKEDMPRVDPLKVWAYADPNKENTIIVEGEKGAVEPGARVVVVNKRLLNLYNPGRIGWETLGDVKENGSFTLSLDGREWDALEITITKRGPPMPPNTPSDAHSVELAPRWRLKNEGR